jgi:hypothetical protein
MMLKIIGYGQIVIMAATTKELLFLDLESTETNISNAQPGVKRMGIGG